MKYYLAIDLGASSGRHIIGYKQNDEIVMDTIYSFPTCMDESDDGLVWNIPRIFNEIKIGIKKAFEKYPVIESLSIDTWAVDYVLMNGDKEIPPFYAYRNARNKIAAENLHKIIPFDEMYKRIGIQFATFNTIYQLFDDLHKGRLEKATDYLMLPSYFTYKLTGVKTHEYTNESTGAFINAKTRTYDMNLLGEVGIPTNLFGKISNPCECVGKLLPSIEKEVGGNTNVVLCASHDTASAFEAVDCSDDGIILSSGTWSLFGVKLQQPICSDISRKANFTNEGGIGYIRFLKNIMGMWVVNQLHDQDGIDYKKIIPELYGNTYKVIFDINDKSLASPKNMKKAILELLKDNPPKDDYDLLNSVYHSLAKAYRLACDELEEITNKKYSTIFIVGGGAKNKYLNMLIEEYTGKKVIALPSEATSLGNIKIQMKIGDKNYEKID